jgi:hypothetical protein
VLITHATRFCSRNETAALPIRDAKGVSGSNPDNYGEPAVNECLACWQQVISKRDWRPLTSTNRFQAEAFGNQRTGAPKTWRIRVAGKVPGRRHCAKMSAS